MTRILSLAVLLLAILMTACEPKNPQESTTLDYKEASKDYKDYITAYSDGILSRTSPIQVHFASPVVDYDQVGKPASDKILEISPAIEGAAVWETTHKLKFIPKNWLPSNQKYAVQVNLDQVYAKDVLKVEKPFGFEFKVQEQAYEVDIRGFRDQNAENFDIVRLQGKVKTADAAKNEEVEKMLKLQKEKHPEMKVLWTHYTNGREHLFELQNLKRANKEGSDLLLEWDGEAIGVGNNLADTVEIPAYNFEVIGAKVVQDQGAEPYILVQYSTPLKQVQDLAGLVNIDDYAYGFETVIDGSELRIYLNGNIEGMRTIRLTEGIKNTKGELTEASKWEVYFENIKPQVRLVGNGGTIIPKSEGLYFPFEAVNLKAVDVEIFKVYENNVLQFLQSDEMNGEYRMSYVGKIIKQERVLLHEKNPVADLAQWTRYHLDLNKMIEQEPGAIYQVRISFRKAYATYKCDGEEVGNTEMELKQMDDGFDSNEDGEYESFFRQFNYYNYDYDLRDNPCYADYYNHRRFIHHNVFASNLGIVAKRTGDRECFVAVTDLLTTQPLANTVVKLYDYQQQPIATAKTGKDGTILFKLADKTSPFMLVAEQKGQKGYLKVQDGYNLSMSRFQVSGTRPYKGIKGEIYGERGVWRPGDSLYLTLVLEDEQAHLPKHHPITFELSDPQGRLYEKRVVSENLNGVYSFHTNTRMDAPTGSWQLNAAIGGVNFSKQIKIETVKPNRLKIETTLEDQKRLFAKDINLATDLNVRWLHGAIAKNLKASVDVSLSSIGTDFDGFDKYEFDDPARPWYYSEEMNLFSGNVDENGKAAIKATLLDEDVPPPGFLRAGFTIRAFEKGGDASIDNFYLPMSPFTHYIGVKVPENKYKEKRLDVGKTEKVDIISLDEEGKPAANRKLTAGIYRLEWSWWWDSQSENLSKFNSMRHTRAMEQFELTTDAQGKGNLSIKPTEWGRYMVRVCDSISGHCSGQLYYAGSPWDDANAADKQTASMLMFSTDKKKYIVGDEVTLQIPTGTTGRALLTLENGVNIVKHDWIDIKENETGVQEYKFKVAKGMAPNIYAHITLMQPHAQTLNDLPIRSYGVIPIMVEDPSTRLKPVLDMPDELAPNSTVALNIKEETGQAMTYTIAVVDEGLLDLTNYRTPDLWQKFYKKEALGVRTWDMYNHVLGAYGDQLDRVLSIGGGGANDADEAKKAIRFKPMVRFLGPFELKAGANATHKVDIPNYIGSVRTMVIARNKDAYGKADKATPVKTPLMVLATLPRVLSPTEEIKLPVTLFAMDDKIKEVELEVKTNKLTKIKGATKQKISFDRQGEKMAYFDLVVTDLVGVATFEITAKSGNENARYTMEIDVRNPNPYVTKVSSKVVEEKGSWQTTFKTIGTKGTNGVLLEVSSIPPINLNKRLEYLIRYPHGCIEQTTSSGFPQLLVSNLTRLDENKKKEIEKNINATIARISQFQTGLGGFSYWPGGGEASEWGSNYAGHFLLEAKAKGYQVPAGLLHNWKSYQKSQAKSWSPIRSDYESEYLMQAYRLYTLALADAADLAAMNRMLEQLKKKDEMTTVKWRLAATYALIGKPEVAKRITKNVSTKVKSYKELSYTYGSDLRDQAMILEALVLMNEKEKATLSLRSVAEQLADDTWHSTQTTAYALLAVAKYSGVNQPKNAQQRLDFAFKLGANPEQREQLSIEPYMTFVLDANEDLNNTFKFDNNSESPLFVRIIQRGQPALDQQENTSNDLKIEIVYENMDGDKISPKSIEQGTDFVAKVSITNPGSRGTYDEMVLNQVFPSGWEIINTRLSAGFGGGSDQSYAEYRDIRDDRVYTYFDIDGSKKHTYKVYLNAAYCGKFYLPTVSSEAMYDKTIEASVAGQWVSVNPMTNQASGM